MLTWSDQRPSQRLRAGPFSTSRSLPTMLSPGQPSRQRNVSCRVISWEIVLARAAWCGEKNTRPRSTGPCNCSRVLDRTSPSALAVSAWVDRAAAKGMTGILSGGPRMLPARPWGASQFQFKLGETPLAAKVAVVKAHESGLVGRDLCRQGVEVVGIAQAIGGMPHQIQGQRRQAVVRPGQETEHAVDALPVHGLGAEG